MNETLPPLGLAAEKWWSRPRFCQLSIPSYHTQHKWPENTNGLDSGRWTLTEVWSALTGVLVAVQVGELLGGHACALRLAVPRRGRRRRQGLPLHAVTLDALFSTYFNIIIYNKYCRILHTLTCSCWGCCYHLPSAAHWAGPGRPQERRTRRSLLRLKRFMVRLVRWYQNTEKARMVWRGWNLTFNFKLESRIVLYKKLYSKEIFENIFWHWS